MYREVTQRMAWHNTMLKWLYFFISSPFETYSEVSPQDCHIPRKNVIKSFTTRFRALTPKIFQDLYEKCKWGMYESDYMLVFHEE